MIILTGKNENETATAAKASVAKNTRALTPPAATKPSGDAVADASVRRVYMGIDLHKLKAVTTVRLDNAPPQPEQGVPTENFVEWVQNHPHVIYWVADLRPAISATIFLKMLRSVFGNKTAGTNCLSPENFSLFFPK